jgi:sigma-E factor negative regulatory protein RseA
MTPQSPDLQEARRAALSASMDGDAAQAEGACRAWREDAHARADWHAYHLIGDLLRSEDCCGDVARDARLLARVREQIAREPAPLAPKAALLVASANGARSRHWWAGAAAAAGFAAVAGVVIVTHVGAPGLAGAPLASPQRGGDVVAVPATALPDGATMLRSAELDRYLAAHRQFANASALPAPGGIVRSAATATPGR